MAFKQRIADGARERQEPKARRNAVRLHVIRRGLHAVRIWTIRIVRGEIAFWAISFDARLPMVVDLNHGKSERL